MALNLFNHYALKIDGEVYRIAEAEIYHDSAIFSDPFCHRHEAQERFEDAYYHYSGFDVTFGSEGVFVGALIRGVQKASDGSYLYGPGRVAYDWSHKKKKREIEVLKEQTHDYRFAEEGAVYGYDDEILRLPRINLSRETMMKALRSGEQERKKAMIEALHLPARYLRLPQQFYRLKHRPDDLKSIVTRLCI